MTQTATSGTTAVTAEEKAPTADRQATAPQKTAPQKTAPQKTAPQKTAPQKSVNEKVEAPPAGNGAAPPQEAAEKSPDTQSATRAGTPATPDAAGKTPAAEAAAEDPLAKAVFAKGAQHSGGLVGGIGIKAADAKLLRKELRRKDGEKKVREAVAKRVDEAMTKAGITYGIKDDELKAAIDDFLEVVATRKGDVVTRKVAEGEAADPGEDGWIEYPLNHRGRSFHELAGLDRRSTRKQCRVVRGGEVLATLHELKKPKSGTDVKGEAIKPASEPQAASLTTVAGDHTAISGSDLAATCDGMCEEDATGTLRVIPEILVDNVDGRTGRIPESGLSEANVGVRGDIKATYGVATTETLFVGEGERISTVDGTAQVQARNLFVNGTIAGGVESESARVNVEEICAVGEVMNRGVSAGRIFVARDCNFGRLEAEGDIYIDGSLRGGTCGCWGRVQVIGDVGTKRGGSNTTIVLPSAEAGGRRKKKRAIAQKHYREEVADLRSKLTEMSDQSERHAKANPYWEKLVKGEPEPPKGVLNVKTFQQFTDFVERRRKLERQISGIDKAVKRLAEEDQQEAAEVASGSTLVAKGTVHLDVSFEVTAEMHQEDGELEVNFTHEGKRFRRHKLSDLRSLLVGKVSAYLEKQTAHLDEKKAAIDKMFEGQSAKPSAPKAKNKTFEIPFTWVVEEEEEEKLEIQATACVRSREPQKILIKSTARLKESQAGVTISLEAEGARGKVEMASNAQEPVPWMKDKTIREELSGVGVSGATGFDLLCGKGSYTEVDTTADEGRQEGANDP